MGWLVVFVLIVFVVMIVIALIVAVIATLAYLAFWLLALVAAIAAVFGIAGALEPFGRAMRHAVHNRGNGRVQPMGDEPAFRSYWFGPVLSDFAWALGYSARGFTYWMRKYLALVDRRPVDRLGAATWWIIRTGVWLGTPIGAVAGYLALAVVTVVGGVVLGVFVGLAQLAGLGLRVGERLRRRLRRAHFACDQCHARFPYPTYRCPGCGAEHRRLLPSSYGILWRRCRCDAVMLPTVNARGRREVPAFCPNGHPISRHAGGWEDIHIPIAGGPDSGKTTLVAGAFAQLVALDHSGKASVAVEGSSAKSFSQIVGGLRLGTPPGKTGDQQAPALQARLQTGRQRTLLYAYDLAGELYSDVGSVRLTGSLDNLRGVLLVIDPGSMHALEIQRREELEDARGALKPSPERPADVYARLLNSLRERGAKGRIKAPLAVVVTKSDALGVDQAIADSATPAEANGAQGDPRVRAWLADQGETNLIQLAEQDFSRVGWFSASALGRMPDASGRPFQPSGTLEPFAWILRHNRIQLPSPPPGEKLTAAAAHPTVAVVSDHPTEIGAGGSRPARPVDRTPLAKPGEAPRGTGALWAWAGVALVLLVGVGAAVELLRPKADLAGPPPVVAYRWSVDEGGRLTGKRTADDPAVSAATGKKDRGVGRVRVDYGDGRLEVGGGPDAKGTIVVSGAGPRMKLRAGNRYEIPAGTTMIVPSKKARNLVVKLRTS